MASVASKNISKEAAKGSKVWRGVYEGKRSADPKRLKKLEEYWNLTQVEKARGCEEVKAQGNAAFKALHLTAAVKHYELGEAIAKAFLQQSESQPPGRVSDVRAVLVSCRLNRAACYLKLDDWPGAIAACSLVLEEDEANVKALFRRAQSYRHLGQLKEARVDLAAALKAAPNDAALRRELAVLKRAESEVAQGQKKLFSKLFDPKAAGALYHERDDVTFYAGKMRPHVYMNFAYDDRRVGVVTMELFMDKVPVLAGVFRDFVTGARGVDKMTGLKLHYEGTTIHVADPELGVIGGDMQHSGGEKVTLQGAFVQRDNATVNKGSFDQAGLVGMTYEGLFILTLAPAPELEAKAAVVGRIIEGLDVVKKLAAVKCTTETLRPLLKTHVRYCGEIKQEEDEKEEEAKPKVEEIPEEEEEEGADQKERDGGDKVPEEPVKDDDMPPLEMAM